LGTIIVGKKAAGKKSFVFSYFGKILFGKLVSEKTLGIGYMNLKNQMFVLL